MVLTTNLLTQTRSDVKDDLEALFIAGAIGTASTTPTSGDTSLGSEVFRKLISSFDKTAADKVIASLQVLTTEANGNDITEVGFFNSGTASSGTMWNRDLLTSITKTSDINLFVDLSITITVEEN